MSMRSAFQCVKSPIKNVNLCLGYFRHQKELWFLHWFLFPDAPLLRCLLWEADGRSWRDKCDIPAPMHPDYLDFLRDIPDLHFKCQQLLRIYEQNSGSTLEWNVSKTTFHISFSFHFVFLCGKAYYTSFWQIFLVMGWETLNFKDPQTTFPFPLYYQWLRLFIW